MMTKTIPANPKVMKEALELSQELLRSIEAEEMPLLGMALKARRLAHILNDTDNQTILDNEIGSIEELERELQANISKLEEMPKPSPWGPSVAESLMIPSRLVVEHEISGLHHRLSSKKIFIYDYVSEKYYELKFSGLAEDAFSRIRESVDTSIGSLIPSSIETFSSIYENLESENPEDWSNAVHSCRRILQDLADAVFPPQSPNRTIKINNKKRAVKIGKEEYVNRLLCFMTDNSNSSKFTELVGSHISFLEDRLWGAFRAAQKGSHTTITSREEADRYVVYTYMIVGDILSLWKENR